MRSKLAKAILEIHSVFFILLNLFNFSKVVRMTFHSNHKRKLQEHVALGAKLIGKRERN